MKKLIAALVLLAGVVTITCCNNNSGSSAANNNATDTANLTPLQKQARAIFGILPNVVTDSLNSVTDAKVALGQALYFDPILSLKKTQSCNTCHDLNAYGVDSRSQNSTSQGDGGKFGGRNSPSVFNAALHMSQFWDGRAKDVEEQAGGPILNPVEMDLPNQQEAVNRLKAVSAYVDMFKKAFPQDADPITWANIGKAIGAFERKLVTPSPFDKFIAGDSTALSTQEKQGLQDFITLGCINCHNGVAVGGGMFQKFGVYEDYWKETKSAKLDSGLATLNHNPAQAFMFKVPSLRNVAKTAPYFHDGSVKDLREAVRIMAKIQLNKSTEDNEVDECCDNITAFLNSLTGAVTDSSLIKDTHPVAAK
jgi:cytochrome c peroxidase